MAGKLKEINNLECKLSRINFTKEFLKPYLLFVDADSKISILELEGFSKIKKELLNILDNNLTGNHEESYKHKEEGRKLNRILNKEFVDNSIVENFSIDDLDPLAIKNYRQKFALKNPEHIFNKMNDEEFLMKLRVLVKNRKTGKREPTIGGLLVFGKTESIKEVLPHFHLEYIDKSSIITEQWKDRVIYDGTWGEENLYNFFFTVTKKTFGIFNEKLIEKENSNIQTALREAFVNAIIHADFAIEEAIKITKYSNYFDFENPGQLGIAEEDFFKNEYSKPHNDIIEEIFRYIGLCKGANLGISKILKIVKEEAFRYPEIKEKNGKITFRFWNMGKIERLKNVSKDEKRVLEYLEKFGKINNSNARENLSLKKQESVKIFNSLIEKKYIVRHGVGKMTYYMLKSLAEDEK